MNEGTFLSELHIAIKMSLAGTTHTAQKWNVFSCQLSPEWNQHYIFGRADPSWGSGTQQRED